MFWRRKQGKVYVYFWKDGRQQQVERRQTRHLDPMEKFQIDSWVRDFARRNGETPKPEVLYSDDRLNKLVDDFLVYRIERLGRDSKSEHSYAKQFKERILPFFLSQRLKDPNVWPSVSIKLLPYLEEQEIPKHAIRLLNNWFKQYWKWLVEEGEVHTAIPLRLRNPQIKVGNTPLERLVTPDEVLAFRPERPEIRLLALLGYFFSLRTQELFGLKKRDFRAGSLVLGLSCSKSFKKLELFHTLAVHINETRGGEGKVALPPKTKVSRDWVCCFSEKAAKEIVQLLKGREGYIFPERPDLWIKRWKKEDMGVTLKDLRRASLHWLGHEVEGMSLLALKNHARHSRIDTTLLYLRKPEEDLPEPDGELDLSI